MKHPQKPVVRRAFAAALASGFGVAAALGLGLSVSAAHATGDETCEPKAEKINLGGEQTSKTITAPEGKLISGYCVKAGSEHNGNGPEYVYLDEPVAEVTITYPGGKAISHYVVFYTDGPTETPSEPTETPTTTQPTDDESTSLPPVTGPATTEPPTDEPPTDEPTDELTKAGPAFPEDGPGGDGAGPTDGVPTRIPAGGAGEDEIEAASNSTDVVGQPVVLGLVGLGAGMAAIGGVIGALRVRARQD